MYFDVGRVRLFHPSSNLFFNKILYVVGPYETGKLALQSKIN